MAQLQSIVETDSQRNTPQQCRLIHLFMEGTFYHAYEWSAWLFVKYVKAVKVSRKLSNALNGDYVMVGFPTKSINNYKVDGVTIVPDEADDKHLVMVLPESLVSDADKKIMEEEYKNWRETIPMSEPKEKFTPLLADHPVSFTSIMKQILEYDLEEHSARESEQFLKDIKRKLIRIL